MKQSRRWLSMAMLVFTFVFFGGLGTRADAAVPASGRVWELVSTEQPGSTLMNEVGPISEGGDALAYNTVNPVAESPSGAFFGYATAVRGPAGWLDTPNAFPYAVYSPNILLALAPVLPMTFSEDLETALWIAGIPLTADAPPEEHLGLYRKSGEEPFELIAPVLGDGVEEVPIAYPGFVDLSSDGSRAIFGTKEHLLPADAGRTEGESVYEWEGSGVHLVDVSNGGTLLSTCGSQVPKANGVSPSASQVFFSVPAACNGVEKIYLRDLEDETTVQISASQCTRVDCNAAQSVAFAGATPGGSLAFLTTKQQLTDDDHDSARDLYSYEVSTGELKLLSGGAAAATGEVNSGLAYPSEGGGRVYFRATGEMLPGETGTEQKLFLADGTGFHLVAEAAFPEAGPQIGLSADGSRALFVTASQLPGSDTDTQPDAYLYDASQETLTRISSGPSGGNGSFAVRAAREPNPKGFEFELFDFGDALPFYEIDANGDRAFFMTKEQLLPEDTNGKSDVYEWWEGQIGLVSPGSGDSVSTFEGATRDAGTALIKTTATLSAADVDGGAPDYYAARIGGGFPEAEAPPCESTPCYPAREPLTRPVPASMTPSLRKRGRLRILRVESSKEGAGLPSAVVASVPSPGPVSAFVWIRGGGKKVVLAKGNAGAIRPGKIRISLRFTHSGNGNTGARKAHLTVKGGGSQVSRIVVLNPGGLGR
jgi:hypothetical protein